MPAKLAKADITPVRQRTQFSCMAASMSMALKCHGQGHCDEDTVNKVMGAKPMQGATWEQALACAQHYGMRGTLTSPCTFKQLKAWTDAGTPVLIAWNPEGREWSHASLVFDVDDDENVHVADPNIPDPEQTVRVVPKSEFYAKWYEKWPNYLVRRPAMAIEREITPDGRQVMASDKGAVFFHGVTREMDRLRREREKQKPGPRSPTPREPSPSWERMKGEPEKAEKSWLGRLFDKTGDDVSKVSLTQPLMTRRDYGVTASMNANDYASILKYAVNLPADVERYVEDIKKKNPDYSEGQAWATAWSIYCKYKNPGSDHCQMDASDYFPGRTAKFPAGKSMTVDEVADVVGPEFKEMNEDPPASVVKVREEMGKKARRSPLLAMDAFAEMLRDSKFEKGVSADPTENMSAEDAAEWERQNKEHADEFKTADLEAVLHRDDDGTVPFDLFFNRTAAPKLVWNPSAEAKKMVEAHYAKALRGKTAAVTAGGKWGFTKGTESACTAGVNKLQKAASRIAKALYAKDEGSVGFLQKHAARAGSKTASMLLKAMESLGPMAQLNKTASQKWKIWTGPVGVKQVAHDLRGVSGVSNVVDGTEHVYFNYEGDLYDLAKDAPASVKPLLKGRGVRKMAGKSGNGLYGFSEKTAKLGLDACSALHHEAGVIAADLFARKGADPVKVAGYLTANAKKGKCAFSDLLAEVAPDVALEVTGTVKKKATDFLAADENADDEVADIISKC